MDPIDAFTEVLNSPEIEFVDSSNLVFFLPSKLNGILYVGFEGFYSTVEEPAFVFEYNGTYNWAARLYAYKEITQIQIDGMRHANSKGEFVWEEFIYPSASFEYIGFGEANAEDGTAKLIINA